MLPTEFRLAGGVEALTGILMCGWSTGFFFAIVSRMFAVNSHRRTHDVNAVFEEIRHNPLSCGCLCSCRRVLRAAAAASNRHTLLFVLSVLAIVPLAALLSHATESVAAKTGDTVGGLLNATLGNLTELVIALAALRAGQYMLVKASIAGAIVTNTLFMLGASFLLGGLKYHVQEYNRVNARLQASLLFLATIALLFPRRSRTSDAGAAAAFTQQLSIGLSLLLITAYALGMLFSLKTHRELFASAEHGDDDGAPMADRRCPCHVGWRDGAGGARQRSLRRVRARGGDNVRDDAGIRRIHRRRAGWRVRPKWRRRSRARGRTGWT